MLTYNTCPPGVICVNHTNAIGVIVVLLIIIYVVNKENYRTLYDKMNTINFIQQPVVQHQHDSSSYKNNIINQEEKQGYNMDVITNPLYPPLKRNYNLENEINNLEQKKGLPINIETRGSGGEFQQIGILYKNTISDDTKAPGNNTDNNVLPLYGKPTYKGSNKWLYYTETDKLNPVKIPIMVNSKDCTDEYGCEELSDGSTIEIPSYNGTFNVKIYKFNKPRYIPYI